MQIQPTYQSQSNHFLQSAVGTWSQSPSAVQQVFQIVIKVTWYSLDQSNLVCKSRGLLFSIFKQLFKGGKHKFSLVSGELLSKKGAPGGGVPKAEIASGDKMSECPRDILPNQEKNQY